MKLITQDIINYTTSFLWKISKTEENQGLSLSALWGTVETERIDSIIEPISLRTTMITLMIMTPTIA